MKILFIGDIYGETGLEMLKKYLPNIKRENDINVVIANGENTSNGRGLSLKAYKELCNLGISCITMGNHTWGNKELITYLEGSNVIVPANYPNLKTNRFKIINYNGYKILVINVLGRVYMNMPLDDPFTAAKKIIDENPSDFVLVDIHAEATSEKISMGYYLDGIKGAIVGTHTHVPTCDNRVLDKGTLYITDVGMTGPLDGVIGVDRDIVVNRFTSFEFVPNREAKGKGQLNAVVIDTVKNKIERINITE